MRNRLATRSTTAAPLNAALIDFFLLGWDGVDRHAAAARGDEDYNWLLPWELTDEEAAALWRSHRTWLMQEWKRRGGKGQPWGVEGYENGNV
jgi:hypothetical protein